MKAKNKSTLALKQVANPMVALRCSTKAGLQSLASRPLPQMVSHIVCMTVALGDSRGAVGRRFEGAVVDLRDERDMGWRSRIPGAVEVVSYPPLSGPLLAPFSPQAHTSKMADICPRRPMGGWASYLAWGL